MTFAQILTLLLTAVAIALFISERVRPDLVALLMLIAFPLLGLLSPENALSSFGNPSVVTVMAVFILGQALTATGVSRYLGTIMQRFAAGRENRLRAGLIAVGGFLSLFMNNMAAAAVLLPPAMEAARRQRTPPSQLLLPLAFATKLAGMATLFTTSNLITSEYLKAAGYPPFGILDFLPVGGIIALLGMGYLAFYSSRLLPRHSARDTLVREAPEMADLFQLYDLEERLWEITIPENSPLAGKTLSESHIGRRWGLAVLNICRAGIDCLAPAPQTVIEANCKLTVTGREENVRAMQQAVAIHYTPAHPSTEKLLTERIGMLEVVIPPRSRAANRTLKEADLREKYGLTAVALWRAGRSYRTGVGEMRLNFGDALLLYGPYTGFEMLKRDPDFLTLAVETGSIQRSGRGWLALGSFALALFLTATGLIPTALAMLLGAALCLAGNCLTMNEAYEAIDWRAVFIIAGMLPLGTALAQTGAAARLAQELLVLVAPAGSWGLQLAFLGLTLLLIQVIPGGAAVPTLLVPIAIHAAAQSGLDPRRLAMSIAIVTGASFLTPYSHPANLLVMGPGGYVARDYLRVGLPLALGTALLAAILLH